MRAPIPTPSAPVIPASTAGRPLPPTSDGPSASQRIAATMTKGPTSGDRFTEANVAALFSGCPRGSWAVHRLPEPAPAIPVRDGQATVAAERLGRDLDPRRGLPALVLGPVDHGHHPLRKRRIRPRRDDLLGRA